MNSATPLSRAEALEELTPDALEWRIESGRWQRPCRGIAVPHSGPISPNDRLWTAVLWAGTDAALAGLTAAIEAGLEGFSEPSIHVIVPASRQIRKPPPGFSVVVHRSRTFSAGDIHPARQPPRTRIERSLIDAAVWMRTGRGAQAVLAAGIQQGLARAPDLLEAVAENPRLRRRPLIIGTLTDIAGGSQALSEIDFLRLIRAHGLPEPSRQHVRYDSAGKRRRLDAAWEEARIGVEIDGSFHMRADQWQEDMQRENELKLTGYLILRFTANDIRTRPTYVAASLRAALDRARVQLPVL